ncbi:MAG: ABC transporter permease [Cryobacterium sp.]|nr:ABC transporter permease [Cryobacterium sp.]
MNKMVRLIGTRLILLPVSLLLVATLSFALLSLMPGDPAIAIAGAFAPESVLNEIRHDLGLDKDLFSRYVDYLSNLIQGDMGRSFISGRPVADELFRYLPNTVVLVVLGIALSAIFGIALGAASAYFHDRPVDRFAKGWITLSQSVPLFVVGILLIYVFFYLLGWVPSPVGTLGITEIPPPRVTGVVPIDAAIAGQWEVLGSSLAHLILPVLTLALVNLAFFGRITRGVLRKELSSVRAEFVRAGGLSEWKVLTYSLRTVQIPILTYGLLIFAQLLGSSTVVELIFAWPGVSRWGLNGVLALDVPVVQAFVLFAGVTTVIVYLVLDVVVHLVDPRVKMS